MRAVGILFLLVSLLVVQAGAQTTTRVSVATDGTQANMPVLQMGISADGNTIVFSSMASTLVADDTNNLTDIFVHDRRTGVTRRINLQPNGDESTGFPGLSTFWSQVASADGQFVIFESSDPELLPEKTTLVSDVFVHDRDADGNGIFDEDTAELPGGEVVPGTRNTRVSVSAGGGELNGFSRNGTISGNGRFVAFESNSISIGAPNVGVSSLFLKDRETGDVELISRSSSGVAGNLLSSLSSVSHTGRHIAFGSAATNLVAGDTNNSGDIFVHDRVTDRTVRVNVASDGTQANGLSTRPYISGDGRYVVFTSDSTNLVEGDTNGAWDVFLHDRDADGDGDFDLPDPVSTVRVNLQPDGSESAGLLPTGSGILPSISSNGRYIGFSTSAADLVAGDTNGIVDSFVLDRDTDENGIFDEPGTAQIRRVSVGPGGVQGNSAGDVWTQMANQFALFGSRSSNLVENDTNGIFAMDAFVFGPLGNEVEPPLVGPPTLIFPQFLNGEIDVAAGQISPQVLVPNRSRIILINNSDTADNGQVRFQDAGGSPSPVPAQGETSAIVPYNLGPWSTTDFQTDGTGPLQTGVIEVVSALGAESKVEGTEAFEVLGRFVSVGSSEPADSGRVYVSVDGSENTGVAIYNPDRGMAIQLTLVLRDSSGAQQATRDIELAPGAQLVQFVTEDGLFKTFLDTQPQGFKGTLQITSDGAKPFSLIGLLQKLDSGALIGCACVRQRDVARQIDLSSVCGRRVRKSVARSLPTRPESF